ncbi:MAG: hypothetical protein KAJ63_01765 [Methyloprofundus sp.]|nr:hypothetical protein [Methyloprofundus sp.]
MVKYIFIALLFLGGLYLYNDYSEIMELKEAHKEWVVITGVEEKLINLPRVSGSYLNWRVTVRLKNGRSHTLTMAHSPIPAVGACLPVIVGQYATGGTIAILDGEQWRFDISGGDCV